ncbi:MAG: hypothetical protein AB7L84_15805 [Acidimicrobiia bacterium]
MHPIERLRYVARASGGDQVALVGETAEALSAFDGDPAGLVAACRRILDRHPTAGPLWWICARVLTSVEPRRESWAAVEELEGDRTAAELAHALPAEATVAVVGWPELAGEALVRRGDVEVVAVDVRGEAGGLVRRLARAGVEAAEVPPEGLAAAVLASDLVLVEAVALGPDAALAVVGSRAAAAVAHHAGIPVWLVAGVGRALPGRTWAVVQERIEGRPVPAWSLEEEQVPLDLVDRVAGPAGVESVEAAVGRADGPVAPELLRGGSAPGTHDPHHRRG